MPSSHLVCIVRKIIRSQHLPAVPAFCCRTGHIICVASCCDSQQLLLLGQIFGPRHHLLCRFTAGFRVTFSYARRPDHGPAIWRDAGERVRRFAGPNPDTVVQSSDEPQRHVTHNHVQAYHQLTLNPYSGSKIFERSELSAAANV